MAKLKKNLIEQDEAVKNIINRGTIINPAPSFNLPESKDLGGGRKEPFKLDITPPPKQTPNNQTSGSSGTKPPEVFRGPQTGKITAVVDNGKFLPFGDDQEARDYLARKNAINQTPAGAVEVAQARQQEAGAASSQNLGNLTPEQLIAAQQNIGGEAPIDWGQAITAGGAAILPSTIKGAGAGLTAGLLGAKIGATAGTAITPGIGTAIGAGVGVLAGLTAGILSNIKSQQKGEIASTKDVLSSARTNMRQLAILAKQDPNNADRYVQAYNNQLANVYAAQRKLKLETQGNLNKYIDDGTQDLSDFELFLEPGGTADIYGTRLQLVLSSGGAYEFTEEDIAEMAVVE